MNLHISQATDQETSHDRHTGIHEHSHHHTNSNSNDASDYHTNSANFYLHDHYPYEHR